MGSHFSTCLGTRRVVTPQNGVYGIIEVNQKSRTRRRIAVYAVSCRCKKARSEVNRVQRRVDATCKPQSRAKSPKVNSSSLLPAVQTSTRSEPPMALVRIRR